LIVSGSNEHIKVGLVPLKLAGVVRRETSEQARSQGEKSP